MSANPISADRFKKVVLNFQSRAVARNSEGSAVKERIALASITTMAREERSAGFIAFHLANARRDMPVPANSPQYLLLDHGRHWSFPKGHIESGENDLAAACRELREETGIRDAEVIAGFQRQINYFFRHHRHGLVHKTVTYFLGRIATAKIRLSSEHRGSELLPFEKACRRLTFAADRELLRMAHKHLSVLKWPGPTPT